MSQPALLTVNEVADMLGVSKFRVYRRIQRGDLRTAMTTRGNLQYLIASDEVDRYVCAGGVDVLSPPEHVGDPEWLTTGEAARRTGLTMAAIRHMCYQGRLRFIQRKGPRSRLRVSAASVERLLG